MSHIYPTVQELTDRFTALGVVAMYGGGNPSAIHPHGKGHGFWLYHSTPQQAAEFIRLRGWCDFDGECIKNDGKESGNECFWMFKDASDLCDCIESIFMGVFPGGISYADRTIEQNGDYKKLAFLSFRTLELRFSLDVPTVYANFIKADAAKIQARRGEQFQVSTCGQTVTLGQ